jgi:hypothetical protein
MALHTDSDLSRHRLMQMRWVEHMELVHIPAQGALMLALESIA